MTEEIILATPGIGKTTSYGSQYFEGFRKSFCSSSYGTHIKDGVTATSKNSENVGKGKNDMTEEIVMAKRLRTGQ